MPEVMQISDLPFGFRKQQESRYAELGKAVMALEEGEMLKCVAGVDFPKQEDRLRSDVSSGTLDTFRAAMYSYMRRVHDINIKTSADFENNCLYIAKK